ncbi:hypothetical protein SO802_033523 [Lithocarpus litseifolius]|uniref:Uncharacterized protein n=1 Tax=Lithocarpus litseifolius TaxID=425828 RepID=A0AAW2BEY2_9ROSI
MKSVWETKRNARRVTIMLWKNEASSTIDVESPVSLDKWLPLTGLSLSPTVINNPITKTHLNLNLPVNIPFAPFSRSDKLGRIADWTRTNFNNPNQNRSKNPSDSVFDFSNDDSFPSFSAADDDSSFRLVDGKPPPKPKFGPKWRFQQQRQLPQRRDEEVEAKKREAEKERARSDAPRAFEILCRYPTRMEHARLDPLLHLLQALLLSPRTRRSLPLRRTRVLRSIL